VALRDLFFGVDFEVNQSELRAGDAAMDSLADETKRAGSSMKKLDKNSKRAGGSLKKIGRTIGAFVGIYELGRGIKYATTQALDLVEETDKFNTVFGSVSEDARQWADTYAAQVNASKYATREAIAETQNLMVGFGATREEAFGLSKGVQELAGDLAAMNNIDKEMAASNLRSVMLGQHRAGNQLGLSIKENTLNMYLANNEYERSFKELSALEQAQVRFNLAVDQSQDSIGKAKSEAENLAGQLRGVKNFAGDTAADMGKRFIPVLQNLVDKFDDNKVAIYETAVLAGGMLTGALDTTFKVLGTGFKVASKLEPVIWGLAGAFAAHKIIAAGSAILTGYQTLIGLQTVLGTKTLIGTAAQWLWVTATNAMGITAGATAGILGTLNAVIMANPIGAAAIATGVLVGAFKLLGDKVEWIGDLWDNTLGRVWDKIKELMGFAGEDAKFTVDETRTIEVLEGQKAGKVSDKKIGTAVDNQYASGTNSAKKGLALVGEKGPELVSMNGGEKVVNNNNTQKILNNKSAPQINITVNGSTDAQETADTIRDEIDNYFRKMKLKGGYA